MECEVQVNGTKKNGSRSGWMCVMYRRKEWRESAWKEILRALVHEDSSVKFVYVSECERAQLGKER